MSGLWKVALVFGVTPLVLALYVTARIIFAKSKGRTRVLLMSGFLVVWLSVFKLVVYNVDNISRVQPVSFSKSSHDFREIYGELIRLQKENGQLPSRLDEVNSKALNDAQSLSDLYGYSSGCSIGEHEPLCWDRSPHVIQHAVLPYRNEDVWCMLFADGQIAVLNRQELTSKLKTNISQ